MFHAGGVSQSAKKYSSRVFAALRIIQHKVIRNLRLKINNNK